MWDWFAENVIPLVKNIVREWWRFGLTLGSIFKRVWRNKWAIFVSIISLTLWAINHMAEAINGLTLANVQGPAATMLQYYAFMNRFVPLSEAFAGAVIAFNIWYCVTVLRFTSFVIRLFTGLK